MPFEKKHAEVHIFSFCFLPPHANLCCDWCMRKWIIGVLWHSCISAGMGWKLGLPILDWGFPLVLFPLLFVSFFCWKEIKGVRQLFVCSKRAIDIILWSRSNIKSENLLDFRWCLVHGVTISWNWIKWRSKGEIW